MNERPTLRIEELVARLELAPHPEGGWYRETWRSPAGGAAPRGTAIYYLLAAGQMSWLHRLHADEIWHLYEGGPLELTMLAKGGPRAVRLGPLAGADAQPQIVIPAGTWFGVEPIEAAPYALVGCTMAPGFEFARLEIGDRAALLQEFAACAAAIERLTPRNGRTP